MSLDIGMVTLDCANPSRLAEFWTEALGTEVVDAYENEFVMMAPLKPGGPRFALQRVDEPRTGKNRMHLDLGTEDRDAEVARLVGLGAKEVEQHTMPGFVWTVLTDPEGNVFCVGADHSADDHA